MSSKQDNRSDQIEIGLNNHETPIPGGDHEIASNSHHIIQSLSPERKTNSNSQRMVYCGCPLAFGLLALIGSILGVVYILHQKGWLPFSMKHPEYQGTVTYAELFQHNRPNDCWMALHGKVYDLTEYSKKHPGGSRIITDRCGSDSTASYNTFHRESLLISVRQDLIGDLSDNEAEDSNYISNGISRITKEELSSHNTEDDCWIAIHGTVYDLTNYARRHPGGSRIVTDLAGKDGTEAFDVFHPIRLLSVAEGDKVGVLFSGTTATSENSPRPVTSNIKPSQSMCDFQRITIEEIALHNTPNDCWMAIHGKVYDLTTYARRHPAGATIITNLAGTDATLEYRRFHGESLLRQVQGDVVGILSETSGINAVPCNLASLTSPPQQFFYDSNSDSSD